MKVIVDTNVPVVANGGAEQVTLQCQTTCIERLEQIKKMGQLVLDNQGQIVREYRRNLRTKKQPGAGTAFLDWVLLNWKNPERCEEVPITPLDPYNPSAFKEFPNDEALVNFDLSDRKFVAVACAHPQRPPILNATDTDWWHFREALQAHGVVVEFLCEEGRKP